MRTLPQRAAQRGRAGFTLIEAIVATAILTFLMVSATVALQRQTESMGDLQALSRTERQITELFTKLDLRLRFAQGVDASTTLASPATAGGTGGIDLTDAFGFPHTGTVVIDPGLATEERIAYDELDAPDDELTGLTRGERGTTGAAHPAGAFVMWEGRAAPIEDQVGPPAEAFDGTTDDVRGPVFYRGDGVGFSYRRPVDPNGEGVFIDGTGIRWGAQVAGRDMLDGCAALVYRATGQITEAELLFDINRDGDQADTFDVGRISDLAWDSTDIDDGTWRVDLSPPVILQETDNYGSDMDNDGFEDPMFLWTPESGRLRVRLFVLVGTVKGREVVKRFETVFFLPNGAAE